MKKGEKKDNRMKKSKKERLRLLSMLILDLKKQSKEKFTLVSFTT